MIETLHIKGFKALADTNISFDSQGPTVLLGPNGAGKSTIIEALHLLGDLATKRIDEGALAGDNYKRVAFQCRTEHPLWFMTDLGARSGDKDLRRWRMEFAFRDDTSLFLVEDSIFWGQEELSRRADAQTRELPALMTNTVPRGSFPCPSDRSFIGSVAPGWTAGNPLQSKWYERASDLKKELTPVRTARLNPSSVAIAPPVKSVVEEDGYGLPAALLDLLNANRKSFLALEGRFKELFPWVEEILLPIETITVPGSHTQTIVNLQFKEQGAAKPYPASSASSGMLIALTLLWILYRPEPDRILCIEEPENSIHPYLLKEVYELLCMAARGEIGESSIQVVVTTHSVDFVNLCKPEEVRICERDGTGAVKVSTIHDRSDLEQAMETYKGALGELWYSGAVGGFPSSPRRSGPA